MQDRYLLKVSLCHIRYFNRILWPRIFTLVIGRLSIIVQKFELFFFNHRGRKIYFGKKKEYVVGGSRKEKSDFFPQFRDVHTQRSRASATNLRFQPWAK